MTAPFFQPSPSDLSAIPSLAACRAELAVGLAGDAGYVNPDGNPVEAPPGTVFAELSLEPAPGSCVRVEVALPPPERWDGRLIGIGNGGGGGWLPSKELGAHLRRGRAMTTTDLGTKHDPTRAGVGNPEGIAIGNYWSWPGDIRYGAETLEELAAMVYPDNPEAQQNMLDEVAAYNEIVASGVDTRYGKASSMLFPVAEGPFFAFSAAAPTVGRMGQEGIMTNDRLQPVIPSTGKPIEGVYLAGVIVGGRHANCYMTPMGGMNHGFDITFGKCAAEFLTEDNE